MTRAQKMVCEGLVALGLLGAVWVAVQRVMVEQTNRTVGMAVDWEEVVQLAAAEGVAPGDVLFALHSAGATHLAVREAALSDLVNVGRIALFRRGDRVEIWADSAHTLQQVNAALRARFPGDYRYGEIGEGQEHWLNVPAAAVSSPNAGAGYPQDAVRAARRAGVGIVARPRCDGVRTADAIVRALRVAKDTGATIVVFHGDQVVGFPHHLTETAQALRQLGLTFGLIELSEQLGAGGLASRLGHEVLRVHSITEQEMRAYGPTDPSRSPRAVRRFVRAARERNVRLLYMRMMPSSDRGLLEGNGEYIAAVADGLRAYGFALGEPRPMADFATPRGLLVLVMLGVCGAALWLMQVLFGLPARWFWLFVGVVVAGGGAAMVVAPNLARMLAALAAAVTFPTLAAGWTARGATSDPDPERPFLTTLLRALGALLLVVLVSLLGGLLIVGLLGDRSYMLRIQQFRGVKVAQMVPVLVVGALWLARGTGDYRRRLDAAGAGTVDYRSGTIVPEWPALWAGLREALAGLVAYWHVALAFAGLVLLTMLMLRSGNEAGGAVLPMELELRALLDRVLVVRPRTKEVFLGHPAMLLGLVLALGGVRRGLWIAFALGTIGQISIVNSLCHIHTPLLLTLLRVLNGLWTGLLCGVVLCTLWAWFSGARTAEQPQQSLPLDEADAEE